MSVQKKKSVEAGLWPENLSSPFYFNLKNPTKMETEDSKEFRTYTCLCNLRRKIQHESGYTNLWSHIEKQLFGTLIILVISKKGFLNLFPNLFPISWPRNFILQYLPWVKTNQLYSVHQIGAGCTTMSPRDGDVRYSLIIKFDR